MSQSTNLAAGQAVLNTLREAGLSGVPWWKADVDEDAWSEDREAMLAAHTDGLRERARRAVENKIVAWRTPGNLWTDEPVDDLPLRDIELDDDYGEDLIEVAAKAADLPPEDIVSIVAEVCPVPEAADFLAKLRLQEYHHAPEARSQEDVHRAFLKMHADAILFGCKEWFPDYLTAVEESRQFFIARGETPPFMGVESEPGLLGDLARWGVSYAFRPVREFAVLCALATLAPVFGRRFVTPTNAGLNLYMIALAQTGTGKEGLIGAPVAALSAAKLDFLIGAGDFTSDSAIELALRLRPNFLAPIDEIGEFIGAAQHRNAAPHARTIRKALLDLFGKSRPDARWTGKQKVEVDSNKAADPVYAPHLSILGCSTAEGFFAALTEANLSDGLINRFLVIRGGRPGPHNLDPSRAAVPGELAKRLTDAYEQGSGGNFEPSKARDASARPNMRVVPWGEGGEAAWREALMWQVAAEDEGRGGIVSRAAENCLKIATIRALARDGVDAAVTADDVAFGWTIVRGSIEVVEAGARENMAGSEFEQLVKTLERAVVEAGPDGIALSKLLERRGIAKHTKPMVDGAIERLVARGVIYTPTIGTGKKGGRPGVRLTARQFTEGPGYSES